jgi:hypothetical protein
MCILLGPYSISDKSLHRKSKIYMFFRPGTRWDATPVCPYRAHMLVFIVNSYLAFSMFENLMADVGFDALQNEMCRRHPRRVFDLFLPSQ